MLCYVTLCYSVLLGYESGEFQEVSSYTSKLVPIGWFSRYIHQHFFFCVSLSFCTTIHWFHQNILFSVLYPLSSFTLCCIFCNAIQCIKSMSLQHLHNSIVSHFSGCTFSEFSILLSAFVGLKILHLFSCFPPVLYIFVRGTTTRIGLLVLLFLNHIQLDKHLVGLLWRSDQPVVEASSDTTKSRHNHAFRGIRTRDPNNRLLRPKP
jgi:hypothetical protein